MTTTSVALIPRTILFGNPEKAAPRVSPDGKRLAYIAPVNNVLNVWVGDIHANNYHPVTQDTDRGVRFYFWAAVIISFRRWIFSLQRKNVSLI